MASHKLIKTNSPLPKCTHHWKIKPEPDCSGVCLNCSEERQFLRNSEIIWDRLVRGKAERELAPY